ncbi:MAG TPA: SdpI family protein [Chitinophagaceae bacterium]|nr:SdpI family protein [Chitinophagaceae bacterium]
MTYFQQNFYTLISILLMIVGLCAFIFPPKFGNPFYGAITKWTMKNETVWADGQKLFAKSIIIIGLIFFVISNFNIREHLPSFSMVLLLIGLWNLSKYIVHKILERKYPDCM